MKHSLIGNKSEYSLDVLIDILPIACILFSEPFSGNAARLLFPLQRLHRSGDSRSAALGARAGGIPDGQDMELPEDAQNPVAAIRKRQLRCWRSCGMNKPASAPAAFAIESRST